MIPSLLSASTLASCRRFVLALGASLLCALPLCAQAQQSLPDRSRPTPTSSSGWVPSLRSLGTDALDLGLAPFRLSPSEQMLTVGTAGLVFSTVAALDRPTYQHLHVGSGPASRVTGALAEPGRWYDRVGPDRAALGTAGLLAASGIALRDRALTRTSVRVVEALVYTKLVTGLAKGFFNRTRPYAGPGPFVADPGSFDTEHTELSMPSGHTARAFAVASVLAHQAERWYVSVPVYGLAGSVGLERVRSGDHWLTDILVGATLGSLIGRAVVPSRPEADITYTPILGTRRIGLSLRF